ncbi:MAG: DsbA family protein [Myxococcota bacterium]
MRFLIPLVLVACGSQSAPTTAVADTPQEESVVASWKGGKVTMSELEAEIGNRLVTMEQEYLLERYELMSRALDGAVDDALLEAEAKDRKMDDVRALLSAEVEQKITMPTEGEIAEFYGEVAGQLRGASLDEVKPMLTAELMQRRMADRYDEYMKELRKAKGVKSKLPYPDLARVELAVTDTDPVLGKRDAPVTIVQFAEYQCYYCNKVSPTLEALLKDYDGKVRLVFKDYPLENHTRAMPAAVAARCAGEQGRYWEMNKVLLGNQQALSDSDFDAYAERIGLDRAAFTSCLQSGRSEPLVRAAFSEGQRAGVQATPTFFVNGLLVSGAQPYDRFKAVIEQELEKR